MSRIRVAGIVGIGAILFLSLFLVPKKDLLSDTNIIVSNPTITLTQEGFVPRNVTIHKGDTVTFTTTTNKPFWPASNLHPTHSVYSAFDPRAPIPPEESWSFTFDKVGKWEFHDHLNSQFTGLIVVVGDTVKEEVSCEEAKRKSQRQQCWEEEIVTTLHTKGLLEAFNLLATLYREESGFASQCHGNVHTLGDAAYKLFMADREHFVLPPQSSYCAFGFYHGFMETMLHTTGTMKDAQDFCDYAEKLLGGDAKGACYHGIGHGLIDGSDPRMWGDPDGMIEEGLTLCERVGESDYYINRCASGIFNSLGIFFDNKNHKEFNLSVDKNDPYAICRRQEKDYFKRPCYQELDTTLYRISEEDIEESLELAALTAEPEYVDEAVESLASFFYHSGVERTEEEMVAVCRGLNFGLNKPCIRGMGTGLVEHSQPEVEYRDGLAFCQSSTLTEVEQQVCMNRVVPYIKVLYTQEKMHAICDTEIREPYYRQFCL